MNKFEQEIMVVDRSVLFADGYFQGFSPAQEIDYHQLIHDNYYYEKRGPVESNPDLKQPIAYCVIVNKETNKVFAYQRSSKEADYHEKRLRGKWSWGIGGHIDKIDLEGQEDPIVASMLRELSEEVDLTEYDPPEILGYINDDTTEVGQVHFGLLYLIRTPIRTLHPKDNEIAWGGFMDISELEEILSSNDAAVESWSAISLEPLRKKLKS